MRFFPRLLLLIALASVIAVAAHAGGEFKRLPSTISLDGAYALAYGVNDLAQLKLQDLKEAPAEDEEFDKVFRQDLEKAGAGDPPNLANYLIDLHTQRAVLVISGFRHFPGNNRPALEISWSLDHKQALAFEYTRYGYAAAWIEPRIGKVTDVGNELESAFRRVLAQREGKAYTRHAADYLVDFSDPIIPSPGELILGVASAYIPKSDTNEFDYRLKFKVVKRQGGSNFVLLSARRGSDSECDQPIMNAQTGEYDSEAGLADALHRLRARLHGAARAAFDREQARWRKLVDATPGSGDRDYLTQRRARELALRMREL